MLCYSRARAHNRKAGLDSSYRVICGNFLEMPFSNDSFDDAYSIEATCHAPKLQEVYKEILCVLKPGDLYVSYEWVTIGIYYLENLQHVEIIQGIERGDALPGLGRQDEIGDVARNVGIEVVTEEDLVVSPVGHGG